jgi:hypothetical protein
MKAHKQLTVGIATAIIAVLVASQSVNLAAVREKGKYEQIKKITPHRLYTEEDVEFLMNANHWTRPEAIKVLDLSENR